ncbi:MAG: glycerol-3-phosphate 1-O-acyltransferase PlsY [Oscillospiraceae bacterium]|nr:glycerol-3-phosphate 1-O-acyltransferase PlsY [Oscillospiraceae bacterium]
MIVFWFAVCAVIGYLLGSFNGAILVSRWIRKEDIRTKGSGNAGLTNFYRNYGGADTLLVLLIDVGKTVAACFIGRAIMKAYDPVWFDEGAMLCGGMSVIGHIFPLWFGFKGGKGILTCGTLAAFIDWRIIMTLLVVFIAIVLITRYVSLGSIVAAVVYPFLFWIRYPIDKNLDDGTVMMTIMAFCLAGIAIYMHHGNIKRLREGTENKFSFHKKS